MGGFVNGGYVVSSEFIVDAADVGRTLAAAVKNRTPDLTWSQARALCERGKVSVNGVRQLDSSVRLVAGTRVTVNQQAPRVRHGTLASERIIYTDNDIVVVDKPAGILSVPFAPGDRDTLIDQTLTALGARGRAGNELGAVHRIDVGTSGLLVFTRHLEAKRLLQEQFRAHTVERRYLAIAHGAVTDTTHDTWLVEDRGDGLRGSFGVFRRPRGPVPKEARHAVTHVRLLERRRTASLIECQLDTGRQHQIRIHLSESGHPLVGEKVYVRDFSGPKIVAPRPMLHAHVLGFVHPCRGAPLRFEIPPPEDFTSTLSCL